MNGLSRIEPSHLSFISLSSVSGEALMFVSDLSCTK